MKRILVRGVIALSAAAFLLGATSAQAQTGPLCAAAKIKCVSKRTEGLLKCHSNAEKKGLPLDPLCVAKVTDKYGFAATGCMDKAQSKGGCATTGDQTALGNKSNAFILDVVNDVDPVYPAVVLDACGAGKKKCIGKKVKGLLGCFGKAAKLNVAVDQACIDKVVGKFDGGIDPAKGCFEKLEAKYSPMTPTPCQTFDDTASIELKVDAFVDDVVMELPTAATTTSTTTTTTTSTTTTTILPTGMLLTTGTPGGICGTSEDGASMLLNNLTCGGLNIGGGGSLVGEGPTPDGSQSLYTLSCVGVNCTVGDTSTAPGASTSTPDCTDTGCNFGSPLPIPNTAIPALTTCVHNTWQLPATGTLDRGTGAVSLNVPLISDVYLTGNLAQPCPVCSASGTPAVPGVGTCDRGPNATGACTSTNSIGLSRDCPSGGVGSVGTPCPGGPGNGGCPANACPCAAGGGNCCDGSHVGPIVVNLSPVTTGTAISTDALRCVNGITPCTVATQAADCIGQVPPTCNPGYFCTGATPPQTSRGCFGDASCETITENGTTFGPITTGTPYSGTLASTFCIDKTGNGLVDASAALSGPGAVSLPYTLLATP